jgi:hypothetical protein
VAAPRSPRRLTVHHLILEYKNLVIWSFDHLVDWDICSFGAFGRGARLPKNNQINDQMTK